MMRVSLLLRGLAAGVVLACTTGSVFAADEQDSWQIQLRYRFEYVDQDALAENAQASTLRTRINYTTRPWNRLRGFVEIDNVSEVLADDFNSGGDTSPGRSQYPVVADPSGTDLNQLWVSYAFNDTTDATLGRQRIILDNQRFVGGVGWRQNEQTYDALSLKTRLPAEGRLRYSYVNNVNRIFGNDVAAGDHSQDTHLLNLHWPLADNWELTAYFYQIDNHDMSSLSTRTFGVQMEGTLKIASLAPRWQAEVARQGDFASNPVNFNATYTHGRLALPMKNLELLLGRESLGGDHSRNGAAFRTPLATLHAFNGWADQFLSTPDAGLTDWYLGLNSNWRDWKWQLLWHDFSSQSGGINFGREVNISVSRSLLPNLSLLFKAASFGADHGSYSDTRKIWLMLSYTH